MTTRTDQGAWIERMEEVQTIREADEVAAALLRALGYSDFVTIWHEQVGAEMQPHCSICGQPADEGHSRLCPRFEAQAAAHAQRCSEHVGDPCTVCGARRDTPQHDDATQELINEVAEIFETTDAATLDEWERERHAKGGSDA